MSGVIVLGAGGHAKVVADILACMGLDVMGFLDDNPASWGGTHLGLPVLGGIDSYARYAPSGLVIGVGDNGARKELAERLGEVASHLWMSAIHPRATVAASVRQGRGLVIAAGAVINPDTVLGDYAIVNTGATVDHDCSIGSFAHIAPGAHLSGGVTIGEGALMGVGSAVAPGRSVGEWAVVGAGGAVVRNIPARVTAKGVPARW